MLDKVLLQIAKSVILSQFDNSYKVQGTRLLQDFPSLARNGAAFVTLHYEQSLRGCIGSIIAHQSLLDDIIANAYSAAFRDPRFPPLSANELPHLKIEVSVLGEPKILEYENYDDLLDKVRPNIDGLIIKHGVYQGTFLPQVWAELQTPLEFLEHLSYKVGANPLIYKEHPKIYSYTVDAIEEKFDEILPL
ncbi:MAG TPA: AMMECR1 domain-containing protein [Sulfurimonas sp. UBA12504]|nr:MAG: AMMECR1 domain-containing protein [Sulfurimonas sp. GWF2_37_8]DAB29745.1 MAG TPA: AMMECR1 domain-containing protein [Sulfurimonas sp. UBA12504]